MSKDTFTKAYIECMLWAETAQGVPEDTEEGAFDMSFDSYGFGEGDLSAKFRKEIEEDCTDFYKGYGDLWEDDELAGHDFWLTRQGHGAGFWDRPDVYGQENADLLTEQARAYGGVDLWYRQDTGEIEGSKG